jgi:choline dehydrogenase-like flavoprotein
VAHHFIYNQDQNKNLEVLDGCRVKRVVIKCVVTVLHGHSSFEDTRCRDGRAVGVEYVHDPQIHPGTDQQIHTAHASRLVVVSAGAFGSPTILERSGIGSVHVLEKASVTPIVELPGVGENYQGPRFARIVECNIDPMSCPSTQIIILHLFRILQPMKRRRSMPFSERRRLKSKVQ